LKNTAYLEFVKMKSIILVIILTSILSLPTSAQTNLNRQIYILKSSGICDGCAEALSKMLFTAGIHSQILGPEQLKSAVGPNDLLIIGGGVPFADGEETIKQDLLKVGAFKWLKNHIYNGGRYIGICAGAYLTEEWIDKNANDHGLNIFPGKIGNYTKDEKAKLMSVQWKSTNKNRLVFFEFGPYLHPDPSATVKVYARFNQDNSPAALTYPYGSGKVGLISPHLEADQPWFDMYKLNNSDGISYDLGIEFVREVLR